MLWCVVWCVALAQPARSPDSVSDAELDDILGCSVAVSSSQGNAVPSPGITPCCQKQISLSPPSP